MRQTCLRTVDTIEMLADPSAVFRAASEVENWPKILPHYRWVKVLGRRNGGRLIEMAARRWLIPVKWRAVQSLDSVKRRVYYEHTHGPTRGMEVEWSIQPAGGVVRVTIVHDLTLKTPIVRTAVGKWIVGNVFVKPIATRTLRAIKALVERRRGSVVVPRGDER